MLNKTVLITGSKGFISSNLINFLLKKNLKIYFTSRNVKDNLYFNLNQKSQLKIPKFDILIHLAYSKNSTYNCEKKINTDGSTKLFKLAKKYNSKIIYISSQSADEYSKSNYGKVKFHLENLAKQFNAYIIRPGLIYKNNSHEGLFGNLEYIIKKLPIVITPSKLDKKINLCSLNSLLEMIYDGIINDLSNKCVNLFENEQYTINQLVKYIASKLNKKIIIIPIHYKLVLILFKIIEIMNLKINLKSDSIKSLI